MRKTILTVLLALVAGSLAFGQDYETEFIKNNWFAGIGGGINMGFDGKKYVDRNESHSGFGFATDVYVGKWLNDYAGFRAGYQGVSISNQYGDFGKKTFNYIHGDAMARVHRNIIPYFHLGYLKIDKGTMAGGAGLMLPIYVSKKVAIVPDLKYTSFGNKAFTGGGRRPASNVSATVGLALNLGGKPKTRTVYVDRVEYVDRPYAVHDTIIIKEKPDVIAKTNEINDFLRNTALFAFDSYDLTPAAIAGLDRVILWMNRYPMVVAKIDGHTDNIGTHEYNMTLSNNRAKAIYDYLVKHGIDKDRLSYEGHGMTEPVADNSTREGRQQNRRIEMTFGIDEDKK